MRRNFHIKNSITCDLSANSHIIKNPRKLPCGKSACLECIELLSNSKRNLLCPFCSGLHVLPRDLSRNMPVEYSIQDEIDNVCSYLKTQLSNNINAINETNSNKDAIQSNLFEFIENDIEIRVESLKFELDKLKLKLSKNLDDSKPILNEKFKKVQAEYENNNRVASNSNEIKNLELLINNALATKENLNKITSISSRNSTNQLENIGSKIIGDLKQPILNRFDLNKLNEVDYKPQLINLNINPYDFCTYINNKYIFIDLNQNFLFVYNKKFSLDKKLDRINDVSFWRPFRVHYEKSNCILFLGVDEEKNSSNRVILLIDKYLSNILFRIDRNLNSSLNIPSHFYFFNDCLHILDISTKNIVVFNTKEKEIAKIFSLDLSFNFDYSFHTSLNKNILAINFNRVQVYIYSMETGLVEFVINRPTDDSKIHSICLDNDGNGLFMHVNDTFSDKLVYYERIIELGADRNTIEWVMVNNYVFDHDDVDENLKGSNQLKFVNYHDDYKTHLIMALWGKKIIRL